MTDNTSDKPTTINGIRHSRGTLVTSTANVMLIDTTIDVKTDMKILGVQEKTVKEPENPKIVNSTAEARAGPATIHRREIVHTTIISAGAGAEATSKQRNHPKHSYLPQDRPKGKKKINNGAGQPKRLNSKEIQCRAIHQDKSTKKLKKSSRPSPTRLKCKNKNKLKNVIFSFAAKLWTSLESLHCC